MAAAEHVFKMSKTGDDGVPLRSKLNQLERTTGKRPPALDGPEIPRPLSHVWAWFAELDAARTSNGMGPNPITYPDIHAWSALTGAQPRPNEVRLLKCLDALLLRVLGEK